MAVLVVMAVLLTVPMAAPMAVSMFVSMAVPVAVPMAVPVAGLTKRFFEQKFLNQCLGLQAMKLKNQKQI